MSVPTARMSPQMQNLGWDSSARGVNLLVCHQPSFTALLPPHVWTRKTFFAVIPSVINSIYSMNTFMKCQLHKVTALRTHTKQPVSFFWLHVFLVSRKPLHFASQNPSHPMKLKKKKKKIDLPWRYNPWTPLHELNWTHFSSFGLQYHLRLTIYLTFNTNISVHMTKKIPSVRALQ